MFRSGRGQSPVRRLAALPALTHVRLGYGAVLVKYVTRWIPAGVIDRPITSRTLINLNAGVMPAVMVPAASTRLRDAW